MAKKASKIKISRAKQKNILGGKKTKGKKTSSQAVVKARKKLVAIRRLKEKNRILRAHGRLFLIYSHVSPAATKFFFSFIVGKVPEHEEATAEDVIDMLDSEELSLISGIDHIRNLCLVTSEKYVVIKDIVWYESWLQ